MSQALPTAGTVPESSLVSVDVLVLRRRDDDGVPLLGWARRTQPPFQGEPALPGVLLGRGERLQDAGRRALADKLGVTDDLVVAVGQLATFDEPLRDPRGPTLSVALWAVVQDAGEQTRWSAFDTLPTMAFDHNRIVADCRPLLGDLLWRNLEFTRSLVGPRFTLGRAVAVTEALQQTRPDPGNLNRLLRKSEHLERQDDGDRATTGGRPAAWWVWRQG